MVFLSSTVLFFVMGNNLIIKVHCSKGIGVSGSDERMDVMTKAVRHDFGAHAGGRR